MRLPWLAGLPSAECSCAAGPVMHDIPTTLPNELPENHDQTRWQSLVQPWQPAGWLCQCEGPWALACTVLGISQEGEVSFFHSFFLSHLSWILHISSGTFLLASISFFNQSLCSHILFLHLLLDNRLLLFIEYVFSYLGQESNKNLFSWCNFSHMKLLQCNWENKRYESKVICEQGNNVCSTFSAQHLKSKHCTAVIMRDSS